MSRLLNSMTLILIGLSPSMALSQQHVAIDSLIQRNSVEMRAFARDHETLKREEAALQQRQMKLIDQLSKRVDLLENQVKLQQDTINLYKALVKSLEEKLSKEKAHE